MTPALRRVLELLAFAVVPLIALVIGLATFADQGRLALDFHEEVYPQAEAIVDGRDPYPDPGAAITDTANAIWPIAAVLPAVPLTAVSDAAADWIATFFVLACLVGALWMLGVRDWRVYGVTLLWPSVIDAYQTANVTPAAHAARGDHVAVPGSPCNRGHRSRSSAGTEVLPLASRHLARRNRPAREAIIAAAIAVASLVLLLPWIGILDYVRLLRKLGETFDGQLHPLCAPRRPGRTVLGRAGGMLLLGAALLALAGAAAASDSPSRPRSASPRSSGSTTSPSRRPARDLPAPLQAAGSCRSALGRAGHAERGHMADRIGSRVAAATVRWRVERTGLEALGRRDRGRARSGPVGLWHARGGRCPMKSAMELRPARSASASATVR